MKKLLTVIVCITALLLMGVTVVSATEQQAGYWVQNATNIEEILAGEAGEGDIAWEVPFLHIKPTIDGAIDKNEYDAFELYEDYLSWMASAYNDAAPNNGGSTEEQFQSFVDSTSEDFFDAYWGWDGEYMYIAFEINCVNGYACNPDALGGEVFLYAVNCLQVGIAPADATGRHAAYQEYGFGVHTGGGDFDDKKGQSLVQNWSPNPMIYTPEADVDYVGTYDDVNQVVTYEIRLHLQTMLGLPDRTVQNGDEINYAWLLSVNGQADHVNDMWQLGFCHGMGGQYSGKMTEYFARVTFDGMPDGTDIPVIELPGMSEDEKAFNLVEYIDMTKENVVATFEGVNAAVEYVTEGEESFARITTLVSDEYGYVYSTKYPKNVLGGQGDYVVVKYRNNFPESEEMGIVFRNANFPEYNIEECWYDYLGTDGEWHVMLFDMKNDPTWQHFILNIGFIPFMDVDDRAQQTIDIQYIKFYQNDPTEFYQDQIFDPNAAGEDEEDLTQELEGTDALPDAPGEEATQAPSAETSAEAEGTVAEVGTSAVGVEEESESEAEEQGTSAVGGADTSDVTVSEEAESEGCASVVGGSLAVLFAAMAAAVALKKKD